MAGEAPKLRPYQEAAIAAVLAARKAGTRRMVVCLPTGAGKTVIFAALARMARRPVLVLAHRSELVAQAREKLAAALGDERVVAVEQAESRAHAEARVVVSSIRSLHAARLARLVERRAFGLVIYDECHHAPAEDNQRVLRDLGCFSPEWDGTLLGVTATPSRGDGLGLDAVFEKIVFSRTLPELIAEGWLCPLRGFRVDTAADLAAAAPAGAGDFVPESLEAVVDIEDRNALVARSIQELARGRRTIAFCVTVRHAEHLARALTLLGVRAAPVWGEMPADRRAETLAAFRDGRLDALTNVGVLTEGFDDPGVSCVAMARPTRSPGLYAQCVGRGTRLAPGKADCLVLDFVDVSSVPLVTLPTLAGLPREIDLEGATLEEAAEVMARVAFDHPGFLLEAGSITLPEIQARAAAFDPVHLTVDPEVRAISPFGWESLGARGIALHFFRSKGAAASGRLSVAEVVGGARGGFTVRLDGAEVARFPSLTAAVEAVDHEVRRMGRMAADSADEAADWRRDPVPPGLAASLAREGLHAVTWGEAVRRLGFRLHHPRPPRPPRREGGGRPTRG
jgi:ATP-dependent helicase IRC3